MSKNNNKSGNNNRANNGGNNNSGDSKKKYSGCSVQRGYTSRATGEHHKNVPCVFGWIRSYGEFLSYVAVPPHKKLETKNDDIIRMVVKCTPGGFAKPFLANGFWNEKKQILTIPELKLLGHTRDDYTTRITRPLR